MLIIRKLNYTDAAAGIVTLKISGWSKITSKLYASNLRPYSYFQSDDTRCCIDTIQAPYDEHIMLETYRGS